jgi:DNA-binding response OmpR family regulator/two-component sensor histidine kinase
MTLILSPLENLISSQNINNKIKNSLKLIHRNAQRLQRMTNQLRDFQKIEGGDLQLRLSRGDIIFFLREIVHSFQDYAIDHSIRYQFNSEQDRFIAWFDADKLDKIIYNLLSNAFKFTPDEEEITVEISIISSEMIKEPAKHEDLPNQYIEIIVIDSGIGIPDDKIENIFQRYYRGDKKNGQQYQGSGVGLAFVYELVNLYQGEIAVESKEGKGAKFTVQIPVDENYLEGKQLVGEFKSGTAKRQTYWDLPVTYEKENYRAGSSPQETQEAAMPVLLVVEDDKEIRNYIKDSLESKFRIFCAENGQEGIKKAIKIVPDIIISDIKMPEVSGIQLCNRLKEDERTSHVPILLLTAYSSHEHKIEGLRRGADAYLSKPFNIDELEAQIFNLLESRKKLSEKYSRNLYLDDRKIVLNDIDEKFLKHLVETIENHISASDFNAEILSKIVGMSRMQLYRKLRGLTDQTVHEFIRSIRLKKAVQILKEKRMTITEVAYEVGFNDLTYFARCFRQQYKKSPSEFISEKS